MEIVPRLGRTKIGHRRARAPSALASSSGKSRRLPGVAPLKSAISRDAGLHGGIDERFRQRIGVPPIGDRQRTAGAMEIVAAARLVLSLLEVRQHVVIAPAEIAVLTPAIVVLMLAADIKQAVDRTRSAQNLAARLKDVASVEPRLRLGLVHPVDRFFLEQAAIAERDVDPQMRVFRPGLEQQHGMFAVRGQAVGEHTSRRARADNDVIEFELIRARRGGVVHVFFFARSMGESGRRKRRIT